MHDGRVSVQTGPRDNPRYARLAFLWLCDPKQTRIYKHMRDRPCFHMALIDGAQEYVKTQEMELSMGVAIVRAGLADLLLRVEEGEMLRDQLVREVRRWS